MSLARAGCSRVALARQQIALQVFHIGIVPFENLKGHMPVLVLPYGKSSPAKN